MFAFPGYCATNMHKTISFPRIMSESVSLTRNNAANAVVLLARDHRSKDVRAIRALSIGAVLIAASAVCQAQVPSLIRR